MLNNIDKNFMYEALKEAVNALEDNEVPVGALIVHKGKVIARAYNQMRRLNDPTAHAEMIAITQAASALKTDRLIGTTLYATIEPCPMCAGALVWARCDRLVFAAPDLKAGACGSVMNLLDHPKLNHRLLVHQGVCEEDARDLMQEFFRYKRALRSR